MMERPTTDFFCPGSGGFLLARFWPVGKAHAQLWLRKPSEWFIFSVRGRLWFIQFFFGAIPLCFLA